MMLMNVHSPLVHTEYILSALARPVLLLDSSLQAVLANAAFCDLLHVLPEDLEGMTLKELFDTSEANRLRSFLLAVAESGGEALHVKVSCIIPPGVHKSLEVSARQIAEVGDQPDMILVELRDITAELDKTRSLQHLNEKLARHSQKLEQANADLELFNRWVSHDLRAPLRFITAIASQLVETQGDTVTGDTRASLQLIVESAEEMGRLIENLLAFAQVDRVSVKKRHIETVRLVCEALEDLRAHQIERDLEIQVDDLPPCYADRALLKQVFLNLLTNALTFTRPQERAKIQIGFQVDGDTTTYFVRDNGVGFKKRRVWIFSSPTCKIAAEAGHHLQGFGIGLTLVKRIIDRHGGRIWAEGDPSCGATFYVQLENPKHAESRFS